MSEQIPQLDDKTGARARSALLSDTLYFAHIPETKCVSVSYLDRMKQAG
jgi:hypothetical protein